MTKEKDKYTKRRNLKNHANFTKKNRLTEKNDFYTFINKRWLDNHKYVPKNRFSTNSFVLLQNKVNKEMQNILFKKIFKEKTPTAVRTKNLYESFSHWNNSLVEKQLNDCIFQLNHYRKIGTTDALYEMLAWFAKSGFTSVFYFYILPDLKNSKDYVPYIQESGFTFSSKDFYLKNNTYSRENRKKYNSFLNKLFSQAFIDNCFDVETIIDIEKQLVKKSTDKSKVKSFEKLYNKYSVESVKRTFHFDFHKFFKLLGFHSIPKNVVIENVKYFEYIVAILNKSWASEEWYAFWVYQILIVISKYQSNLNETCFAYFNTIAYGSYTVQPLNKTSVFRLEQIMNTEMNKKYLEYYKNTQEIELTKQLVERIKISFKEHFLENKWLSQKTKEKALKKLNTMNITIGYKSLWQPDPTCDFKPDDGFGNYELYMNWYLEESIRYFSLGVPKTNVWMKGIDQDTFTVNASYNNNKNELILPNAILQPPFVNIKKSMAYNLANIGIIIGHEMMHAFDEDGCKFNEKGEYDIWLTESEIKKYKEKQRDIIKHYESMSHNDKIKMDHNLTLSENLADIGGFLIAENALIDYLNENKITAAELDTQLKDFYSFYAKEWRTINKPKFAESLINYDTHSFAKNRVNSVLAISPNFHRVFGIEKGHKLYSSMQNPLL